MKKGFTILFALIALIAFSLPVYATNYDYTAQVFKKGATSRGGIDLTPITSNVTFKVLTINSDTAATITRFGDNAGTSVTNPVTTTNFASPTVCNAKVQFRTTASTVDLIVVDTNGGFSAFVEDFSPNTHSIVIDETPGIMHHGVIWFGTSNNVVTDTEVNFLPDTEISDVIVEVVTADPGMTLNVGTNDTAAGFCNGTSMTSTGYIADTGVITDGTNIDYVAASKLGSLIATTIDGTDTAATVGGVTRKKHVVTTAGTDDDLQYTGSSSSDTAAGYIHYWFERLR
jgi:hypothetical protein